MRIRILGASGPLRESVAQRLLRTESDTAPSPICEGSTGEGACVLILLDEPGRPAGEICGRAQDERCRSQCCTLVLTPSASAERIGALLTEGADDFLVWPRDEFLLEARVRALSRILDRGASTASEALRESEGRLQLALDSAGLGIWDWNIRSGVVLFSDRWASMIGYRRDEIAQRYETWLSLVHPEDLPAALSALQRHFDGFEPHYEVEFRMRSKAGSWVWILAKGRVFDREVDGKPLRMVGLHLDVTRRKEAEAALRTSEQRLETVLEGAGLGWWDWDLRTGRVVYSHHLNEMLGYAPDEIGSSRDEWMKLLHDEDRGRSEAAIADHLEGRTPRYECEMRVRTKSGEWLWLLDRGKVVEWDGAGRPVRAAGTHLQVTKRKLAEIAREASEERFALAVQGSSDGIWDWNLETNQVYLSPRCREMLGYTADEFPRNVHGIAELLVHREDRDRVLGEIERSLRERLPLDLESRVPTRGGEERWFRVRGLAIWDAEGRSRRMAGSLTDITEYRRAQWEIVRRAKALEETTTFLNSIVDNMPAMLFIKDAEDLRFVRWNRAAERITGLSTADVLGKTDRDFFPEQQANFFIQKDREVLARGDLLDIPEEPIDTVHLGQRWLHTRKIPILGPDGHPRFLMGISQDITERKQARQELVQAKEAAETMARMKSEFLANMSHEIRTPMNGVIGMTGLLLDTPLSREQRDYVETIRASGDTLLTIINDILDFSKVEAGKLELENVPFDPRSALEDVIDLLAEKAQGRGLQLIADIPPDLPSRFAGDPSRLRQILTNLLGNAVKFTERGEIVARLRHDPDGVRTSHLRFEIEDTGIGIASEALDRLFEPFVQADGSTTRRYGGTGLGLSISRRLVELMGGEMGVSSVPGEGSTFWFTVSCDRLPPAPGALEAAAARVRGLRLVLAAPHARAREVLASQLRDCGLEVFDVASGAEVLRGVEEAAASGSPFHAALLDLDLPDVDGITLSRRLQGFPAGKALLRCLLAPWARRGVEADARRAGVARVLVKPARLVTLLEALTGLKSPRVSVRRRRTPRSEGDVPAKGRVLVAEDNLVNQKLAVQLLQKLGYRADVVADGVEALAALEAIAYDAVLMDCQMPRLDGFEAAAEFRRRSETGKRLPIIALTAGSMPGDRERCVEAGMDDYVPKPIQFETLKRVLRRWIRTR